MAIWLMRPIMRLVLTALVYSVPPVIRTEAVVKDGDCSTAIHGVMGSQIEIRCIGNTDIQAILKSILATTPNNLENAVSLVLKELAHKNFEELYAIKLGDSDDVCKLLECQGMTGSRVSKFADAVLSARDKEQTSQTASTNNLIAVSGAIISILSFALSGFNAVRALKGSKSDPVTQTKEPISSAVQKS